MKDNKQNGMPTKGGTPTGILSGRGKQKVDALGGGFNPSIVASSKAVKPVGPKKRDNRLK